MFTTGSFSTPPCSSFKALYTNRVDVPHSSAAIDDFSWLPWNTYSPFLSHSMASQTHWYTLLIISFSSSVFVSVRFVAVFSLVYRISPFSYNYEALQLKKTTRWRYIVHHVMWVYPYDSKRIRCYHHSLIRDNVMLYSFVILLHVIVSILLLA